MEDEFLLFVIASFQKRKFRSHVFFFFFPFFFIRISTVDSFYPSLFILMFSSFWRRGRKEERFSRFLFILFLLLSSSYLSPKKDVSSVLEFEDTLLLCGGGNKDKFKIISLIYY